MLVSDVVSRMHMLESESNKPRDLVDRTFLMEPKEDGQRFRAHIVEAIEEQNDDLAQNQNFRKFREQETSKDE
jgi:hypothetical protein